MRMQINTDHAPDQTPSARRDDSSIIPQQASDNAAVHHKGLI